MSTGRRVRPSTSDPAVSYWLGSIDGPIAGVHEGLAGKVEADVAIIGGGYTGLWTAQHLLDSDPSLRIVVCERDVVGYGASGRNGGFLDPSLTHGLANGLRHYPDEIDELEQLAAASYAGLRAFVQRYDLRCDFEPTGMLDLAVAPWQVDALREEAELHERFGHKVELLDRGAARAQLDSPLVLGALHRPGAGGVLHPAKLARELARVAVARGAAVHERSAVTRVSRRGSGVRLEVAGGAVHASQAVLATNAYSGGVLGRTRRHYVPVYDYVLVTEPLDDDQLARIGWSGRQGLGDCSNQFHYFRLIREEGGGARNRILWGGYDAIYYYGNGVGPQFDDRQQTYALLEAHFRRMFPQLADVAFTHRWGGAIATTTRFTPVFGQALGGRLLYALGYTGLGVGASRFAGRVLADRIVAPDSPLLRLRYTTSAPSPFPPEPLRWAGVTLVRRALARSDRTGGRRGPLLRVLDAIGIGFDS